MSLNQSSDRFGAELKAVLKNTADLMFSKLLGTGSRKIFVTEELLNSIETSIISTDICRSTTTKIMHSVREKILNTRTTSESIKQTVLQEIRNIIDPLIRPIDIDYNNKPQVVLLCGLNGSGKTTTIGKISYMLKKYHWNAIVVACDVTRKAAANQLRLFTNQLDISVFAQKNQSEKPTSIVTRALKTAISSDVDVVLIDTPGYYPEHHYAIKDLKMIVDTISDIIPDITCNIVVTIDSSGGQNAINQIKQIVTLLGVNGMVITKVDTTQKAGIVISACDQLQIPIHGIGIGAGVEDLQDFSSEEFINGLSDTIDIVKKPLS
ncbi:MAG: signal recognition particle receptor subunit alpha [Alphaproteobacteria bacterium]|nr:signal recognition particle receptor subunit alpha [Rickettsiales bacterium]